MPQLITIGETMAAFTPDSVGALRYVQNFGIRTAGAESNVAVGLAKLGLEAAWVSRLGTDEFGCFIHNALVIILIDKDGVDSAGQLELVLKSHDVQLLGGEAALAHGSDVVGVQAVAHTEHSVHGVAGLHAGDELGGLLHHIDFGLRVGAG